MVNVYQDGQHIPNSPFKINVTRNEVGNAGKVKVYGDGLTEGMANEVNEFYVDTKDAGGWFRNPWATNWSIDILFSWI